MSRRAKDRLYGLLPSVYRQQDITQQTPDGDKPLQDLLSIMEGVLETLENDVDRLYENWFIETCSEWVVPYIGDLVGASLLRAVQGTSVSGRAYVANTIHYRKRKGTVAVMEEIARDVTGYDAHAVEFFQVLSTTQNINHVRLWNQVTPRIVNPDPMELVDKAFDPVPHTLDVRSIKNGLGYYNIPNLGIFLWRLTAYPVRHARAFDYGDGKFSFSQIGEDLPLFNHPISQVGDLEVSGEINVSTPIRKLTLKNNIQNYYGEAKSILVEVDGVEKTSDQIIVADLSDVDDAGTWNLLNDFDSKTGMVAIDPTLGRLALPNKAAGKVYVTYYYGFSADMGGGFYRRDLYEASDAKVYPISARFPSSDNYSSLGQALSQWETDKKPSSVFEILDSETYVEGNLNIELPLNTTLVIRSAQEQRATLTSQESDSTSTFTISVSGEEGSSLALDGLLIDFNMSLVVNDKLGVDKSNLNALVIQNCTLVPPEEANNNSITVNGNDFLTVTLSKAITGPVSIDNSQSQIIIKDSIVDKGPNDQAIEYNEASIENSTIFGKSKFETLDLASNVIFTDTIIVKRRQIGCVRFSYVPNRFGNSVSVSRVPRCYRCQPQNEASKVAPRFTSETYGQPGYLQLHKRVVKEISEGADNEAEMGAFNQTYQSHRINNLLATFAEYLPFGLEAGIILVT